MTHHKRLPAEWEPQSLVQIAWPHAETDWQPYLEEAEECYCNIAREISRREKLVVVTPNPIYVTKRINKVHGVKRENVKIIECPTNDTWTRDHAFITTIENGKRVANDFGFNGWGLKFASDLDNMINARILCRLGEDMEYQDFRRIILEGGSVESDGMGTILTTKSCLLSQNRNYFTSKDEADNMLNVVLHATQVLWLDFGYLAGDDTDGHIDTLARLCPDNTIVYVQCLDRNDEHYTALSAMEKELKWMTNQNGEHFRLLPLPMPDAIYDGEDRLPATYANFLIINGAVLMPTYNQPDNDRRAKAVLAEAFPGRDIVGIDCRVLIRQHGSLHCVTMQYPK